MNPTFTPPRSNNNTPHRPSETAAQGSPTPRVDNNAQINTPPLQPHDEEGLSPVDSISGSDSEDDADVGVLGDAVDEDQIMSDAEGEGDEGLEGDKGFSIGAGQGFGGIKSRKERSKKRSGAGSAKGGKGAGQDGDWGIKSAWGPGPSGGKGKRKDVKDLNLYESEIVARWNVEIGDPCFIAPPTSKATPQAPPISISAPPASSSVPPAASSTTSTSSSAPTASASAPAVGLSANPA